MKSKIKLNGTTRTASTVKAKRGRLKGKRTTSARASSANAGRPESARAAKVEAPLREMPAAPAATELSVLRGNEAREDVADEELRQIIGDLNEAYLASRRCAILLLECLLAVRDHLRRAKGHVDADRWETWVTRTPAILAEEARICLTLADPPLHEGAPVSAVSRISLGDAIRLLEPLVHAFALKEADPHVAPGAPPKTEAHAPSGASQQFLHAGDQGGRTKGRQQAKKKTRGVAVDAGRCRPR